jgi:uncharacterized protein
LDTCVLAVALVVYSSIANQIPAFNKAWFVPANLTTCALVLLFGHTVMDLSAMEVWGSYSPFLSAAIGLVLGAVLVSPLFLIAGSRWAKKIADQRVAHLAGGGLLYQTLVRIPLGTALLEEVAFRGVLFASWRPQSLGGAAVISSVAFGLWHISPTINMVRENRPNASTSTYVRAIAGAIVFTAVGFAFILLREITDSLVAPLFLHATVNSLATVASVMAHRRATLN